MSFFSSMFKKKSSLGLSRVRSDTVIGLMPEPANLRRSSSGTLPNSPPTEPVSNISPISADIATRQRSFSVFSLPPENIASPTQNFGRARAETSFDSSAHLIGSVGFRDDLYNDTKDFEEELERLRAWDPVLNTNICTSKEQCSNNLRFLIRKGVPDIIRPQVWKAVSGCAAFLDTNPSYFVTMLRLVFGPKVPSNFRHVPSFGGVISPSDHFLSDDGFTILKRLLCLIAIMLPEVEYCPALPDAVLICLMFLSEAETLAMIHVMVQSTKHFPRYYFNTSNKELAMFTLTFDRLISRHLWSMHKHISQLGVDGAKDIAEPWFSRLFVSFLPYQTVLRVFDVYVNEGSKILYKTGLAILALHMDRLLSTTSKHAFMKLLHKVTLQLTDADMLIKNAFGFRMKDHTSHRLDKKDIKLIESLHEPAIPVYYRPKMPLHSSTISDEQFEILWSWVPRRYCIQDPVLVFSTNIHGCSLSTFYHMCSRVSPSILAVKTKSGAIIGAYLSDPWIVSKSITPVYYGDGECFVFSLAPAAHHWTWSGENDYYMLAANDHIAVGGGSGSALWLNHTFDFCISSVSETFRNPPLESEAEFLGCVTVEVFGFQ